MLAWKCTVQYRTASVLIAYEYRTSKVCLAYLQRIWTSWTMPDDWVIYLTYNLRIITVAIRRVRWSYADIRWSYTEYALHTPTYAGICGHYRSKTLLIGSIRYPYGMYTPNSVFSRAFGAYEKIFYEFSTQLLSFFHTQQCDRAIKSVVCSESNQGIRGQITAWSVDKLRSKHGCGCDW